LERLQDKLQVFPARKPDQIKDMEHFTDSMKR